MARPFANVLFAGREQDVRQPQSVLVRQRPYQHDVVVLDFGLEDNPAISRLGYGAPVEIVWGWRPGGHETFVGFLHHKRTHEEQGKAATLKVYCVGVTHRFDQRSKQYVRGPNTEAVVRSIAREFGFAVEGGSAGTHVIGKPQAGGSYWKLLGELAKDDGLLLTAVRTTLYLKEHAIDRVSGRQPLFSHRPSVYQQQGALRAFTRVHGGVGPEDTQHIDEITAVDSSGQLRRYSVPVDPYDSERPVFTKPRTTVAHSRGEATHKLTAAQELTKFKVRAKTTLSGHAQVRPGATVQLTAPNPTLSGFWWVSSADHLITTSDYVVECELARERVEEDVEVTEPARSWSGRPQVTIRGNAASAAGAAPRTVYTQVSTLAAVEKLIPDPLRGPQPAAAAPPESFARSALPGTVGRAPRRPDAPAGSVPRLDVWRAEVTG